MKRIFEPVDVERPPHLDWKPQKPSKMKKIGRLLKNAGRTVAKTVAGDNRLGEAVHGFLDLFPVPNQILAKVAKALIVGTTRERKEQLDKIFTERNVVAFMVFGLFIAGVITIEDAKAILNAIGNFF